VSDHNNEGCFSVLVGAAIGGVIALLFLAWIALHTLTIHERRIEALERGPVAVANGRPER
jgi:hypothetical protein